MSAQVQRRPPGGAPWLLALLLAIIVAAIVVAAVFGTRIKNALSPAATATTTPTATAVVITATPLPATATALANPAILPSATPGGNVGVSTPVPGATPLPTVPGLQVGMITYEQKFVANVQQRAAAGDPHYRFYLDPRQVVLFDLPHYGFTRGFTITSPAPSPTPTPYNGAGGRPVVKFLVDYQSRAYTVFCGQPATHGAGGIWLILSVVSGRQ